MMRIKPSHILRSFYTLIFFSALYAVVINLSHFSKTDFSKSVIKFGLKDWHDYNFIKVEKLRSGPGEQGNPVVLTGKDKALSEQVFTENGFCRVVSDKIAIDRAIPDIRHPDCSAFLYNSSLPTVSIIIPVFQEHWTTMLRTIMSIKNRAPPNIINEIILVDDGSFKPFLKKQLDDYCSEHFPNNFIRVIHHPKRVGLITARLTGAKIATGDVLIFLDSHIEAGTNWLPPLLHPITLDYRTVTCPFIDVIDGHTFVYRAQDEGARGAFDWILNYKRLPRLPEDKYHPAEPFSSPVMAGGLFAISSKFFWELGGYDPGLQIWGAEQYELSFKLWMCGGRMIDIPCSRIGHIYRGTVNFPDSGFGNFLSRNYRRLMDVWMDEYATFVKKRRPQYANVDPGDLTEQHALRKKLKCKSFKWFMEEIAFDLIKKYPTIDPIPYAVGKIQIGTDCLDVQEKKLSLKDCSLGATKFKYTYREEILLDDGSDQCLDVQSSKSKGEVEVYGCHGQHGNQHWTLEWVRGRDQNPVVIKHVSHDVCLQMDPVSRTVFVNPCVRGSKMQRWHWDVLQWVKGEKLVIENHIEA